MRDQHAGRLVGYQPYLAAQERPDLTTRLALLGMAGFDRAVLVRN